MPKKDRKNTIADDMMPPPKIAKNRTRNIEASPVAGNALSSQPQSLEICPVSEILQKAQTNQSMHLKYFKALNEMYEKMGHEKFKFDFLKGLRVWMKCDERNICANVGLEFGAKYLTTLSNDVTLDTHPMLVSTFEFLLNTISLVANVRFRLCQFVNLLLMFMGPEAALEDYICRNITKYMLDRLTDLSAAVRVQAVKALNCLQLPDDPNDVILRSFLFHLANDSSSAVRIAIVTAISHNSNSISAILERLWDVDENVRRHVYFEMSKHSVKVYELVQRITFLEQGLNDKSDRVREIVTSVLLPQWLHSYDCNYVALVASLKIDSNDFELKRFVKIAKQGLFALFKNESFDKLTACLPLTPEGGEFGKCIPFEVLTVELAVYWAASIEYLQSIANQTDINADDDDEHLQKYICELSTFCDYLMKFLCLIDTIDVEQDSQWYIQENRYKVYILLHILLVLDVGDEIGRGKLRAIVAEIMLNRALEEEIVRKLVLAIENSVGESCIFVDIVRRYYDPLQGSIDLSKESINSILDNIKDHDLKMRITQISLEILDLREQKTMANQQKNYKQLHDINEKLTARSDELLILINQTELVNAQMSTVTKKMTIESKLQCLQIFFYTVASKHTSILTPNIYQLYKDFVCIEMESMPLSLRDWALKCGIACSMLYGKLAKDVYNRLTNQFYRHHNMNIWNTSIKGVFELIDKYGFEYFEQENGLKLDEDVSESSNQEIITTLLLHFLDTCKDVSNAKALIIGFCRLVLSGRLQNCDYVSKLILKFHSPACDAEIHQILDNFFQTMIKRQKQMCLVEALLPTLHTILNSTNNSLLQEIKPEEIIKNVVNLTMPKDRNTAFNFHNTLALMFLNAMSEHYENQKLIKLLSKELPTLRIITDVSLRKEFQTQTDSLICRSLESYAENNIKKFQKLFKFQETNTTNRPGRTDSDEEIL